MGGIKLGSTKCKYVPFSEWNESMKEGEVAPLS